MNSANTTARPSVDLDATDELPVLDVAAYEAEALSRATAEPSGGETTVAESDPPAAASPPPDTHVPNATPPAPDADVMSSVEHWIVQKTEELRGHYDALSLAQRERNTAVARAGTLSRQLAETTANLEALNGRERALAEALTGEQEAAKRRAAELDAARSEAVRLTQQLVDARAAEVRQNAALAASAALLEQRSAELHALQRTHGALAADAKSLQTQLASCLESLQSRESYRAIYQSSLQELDAELAAAKLQTTEQQARADQLHGELQSRDRQLQSAVQERDAALRLHNTESTQYATERGEVELKRSALESRLAELTREHADARGQLLATQATLATAQQ
ncbi:MAG: hypothetical protein WAM21_03605, partial [Steroidobacteraceae bacterium]